MRKMLLITGLFICYTQIAHSAEQLLYWPVLEWCPDTGRKEMDNWIAKNDATIPKLADGTTRYFLHSKNPDKLKKERCAILLTTTQYLSNLSPDGLNVMMLGRGMFMLDVDPLVEALSSSSPDSYPPLPFAVSIVGALNSNNPETVDQALKLIVPTSEADIKEISEKISPYICSEKRQIIRNRIIGLAIKPSATSFSYVPYLAIGTMLTGLILILLLQKAPQDIIMRFLLRS
jgi:hypothetical protein